MTPLSISASEMRQKFLSEDGSASPRRWRVLLVLCFLLLIGAPLVAALVGFDPGVRLVEKRRKAQRPAAPADARQLALFPRRFDAYYKDHFGLRAPLIVGHHWIKRRLLGVSPVAKALVGRQGWLYLAGSPVIGYQRMRPLSAARLEVWRRALETHYQACRQRGALFVLVVAPNKHTIYPEYLPTAARPLWRQSPWDQLVEHLAAHSEVPVVDLRPALLQAKEAGWQVYRRHDSHWSPLGEFAAYREWIKVLGRYFPQLQPLPLAAFTSAPEVKIGGDLSLFMGTRNQAREEVVQLTLEDPGARLVNSLRPDPRRGLAQEIFEAPEQRLRAVMAVDSFGDRLKPYLAEHFARVVFNPGMRVPYRLIEKEQPDIVVLEVAERFFGEPVLLRHLLVAVDAAEPGAIFADGFESGDLRRWGEK